MILGDQKEFPIKHHSMSTTVRYIFSKKTICYSVSVAG